MNKQEVLEVISDKLKDIKYYAKEMGEVLKSANYFIDELEKQVKKVEQKPKGYHVTDEYSFNCLMKELIEKGYTKTLGGFLTIKTSYYSPIKEKTRNYIYLHDNDSISFSHELVRDGYDVIEYYKEPRLKAWYIDDKYSWDCLMKELEEQGYKFSLWGSPTQNKYKTYNCVAEDEEKDLKYRDFEQMKEGIRKDAVDTATLVMSYASIMYLRDHEGYGKVRLKRFMDYVQKMLNGVGEEYDFEDMIVAIEEETGYKLKLPPRQIF